MSNEEMRIAVAESCGWKWDVNDKRETYWFHPDKPFLAFPNPPNYPRDLNACHEMEKTLDKNQQLVYGSALYAVVKSFNHETQLREGWREIHATATQRCEAFLRTKGLWHDKR